MGITSPSKAKWLLNTALGALPHAERAAGEGRGRGWGGGTTGKDTDY